MRDLETLLNQRQAAAKLGLSVRTMERHRVAGTGPRYIRMGRLVRFRPSDLAAWVDASARNSTSDTGAVA